MRWLDRLLAKRIAQGDEAACTQLVQAHYKPIYRFLAHLCGQEQLAEDLTQETFAAAWLSAGHFSGSSALSTWLYRIARNKFLDYAKRRKITETTMPDGSAGIGIDRMQPVDHMLASERARQLAAAVARLDVARREVIVLHYFQELSYREVAQILDEAAGTVKWRVNQAMAQLRKLLEEELEQ